MALPVRLSLGGLCTPERCLAEALQGDAARVNEASSLLAAGRDSKKSAERQAMLVKAALYAVQVFYSFFIMWVTFSRVAEVSIDLVTRLLFMTYNGFVMLAVAVGAFIGYLAFGSDMTATKSVACH